MSTTLQPRPSRSHHLLSAALLVTVTALASGCAALLDELDGVTDDCTAGRVTSCMCPDGSIGAQACLEDGESYGACACGTATQAPGTSDAADPESGTAVSSSDDDGSVDDAPDDQASDAPFSWDDGTAGGTGTATPEPEPLPDPTVELRSARMRVYIIGGSMTAAIEADWSVTGRDDVVVDIEVLSSVTYRSWTAVAAGLPAVYFTEVSLPVTQGERRFDVRVAARDGDGHRWTSNTITIE